ncbi:agamous-like MADS-box protein AGL66 [Actinidia eriantha]|uniref:agamous-like MADS-box protein AGL66 n=1 Tax=Actinidia eriantha TaxID=165200 RepID=UPI0025844A15|nr:agamous-like MADS-box protein AGL66 [Actinidia eriantha]
MGRKVDMKKIEDITKCQVTFSKRRSSLMKKAHEISVCCDVDVAFVTFSPSGRVIKFSSQRRIEDVIHRYINLTVDRRYNHIKNVQEKQEKLYQLDHIKGDTSKLQYLDKQFLTTVEILALHALPSGSMS